jgi:energy-coupling factor transporter transmembrane protein EcfT
MPMVRKITPINDAEPSSPHLMPWFATALVSSPGWISHALTICAVLWVCWETRYPGRRLTESLLWAIFLCVGLLLFWITRQLVAVMILGWYRHSLRSLLPGWHHWCVIPMLLCILWGVVASDLSAAVALRISRPAMDEVAQAVLADGHEHRWEKERRWVWVGVLCISSARFEEGVVELTYAGKDLPWGRSGMYFSPTGVPSNNSYYQEHVMDGWYWWNHRGW